MSTNPHGQAWYARLAATRGGYQHPWRKVLLGPSGEDFFDALLEARLGPGVRVLEAGCGHGPDAARHASRVARWVGYDFTPGFLERARREVPNAEFVLWHSGKELPPQELGGPFDLIVSRRGPTSVIDHLPALASPGARLLYAGPGGEEPAERVRARLKAVGWSATFEAVVGTSGLLPSFEDYALYCEYNGEEPSRAHWNAHATPAGLPFVERRYVIEARATPGGREAGG